MPEPRQKEVPPGAGVLPLIPVELNIQPLLLAVLHATVFLSATDEVLLDRLAADECFDYLAGYMRRLKGSDLQRVRDDLAVLADFGRREKWSLSAVEFLQTFLESCGRVDGET